MLSKPDGNLLPDIVVKTLNSRSGLEALEPYTGHVTSHLRAHPSAGMDGGDHMCNWTDIWIDACTLMCGSHALVSKRLGAGNLPSVLPLLAPYATIVVIVPYI